MSLFGQNDIRLGKVGQALDGYTTVRIDRATMFGNPFPVKEIGRDAACDEYELHFEKCLANKDFRAKFNKLLRLYETDNILLVCHCVDARTQEGRRCHGRTIQNYLIKGVSSIR